MSEEAILQKHRRLGPWYDRANIPVALRNRDFGVFDFQDPEPVELAQSVLELWDEGGFQGIGLFGLPGRGKSLLVSTMLCSYLSRWVGKQRVQRLLDPTPPVYMITLARYHRLHLRAMELDRMMKRVPEDWPAMAAEWAENYELRRWIQDECPHLVVDDVGKEHRTASGFVEASFDELIRTRHDLGLSTSITSNLTDKEFQANYGQAQYSFLKEVCVVLPVVGRDYRTAIA